jgi:hypothetical protein
MRGVADELTEAFAELRHLFEDRVSIQGLAPVRLDDPVGVFEIAFDSRPQHFRN